MTTHRRPHGIFGDVLLSALLFAFVLGVAACDGAAGDNDNARRVDRGVVSVPVLGGLHHHCYRLAA